MKDNELNIKESGVLLKYLEGKASEAEKLKIKEWLDRNDENNTFFNELKELWDNDNFVETSKKYNTKNAWDIVEPKIRVVEVNTRKPGSTITDKSKKLPFYLLRVASVLLIALIVWQIVTNRKKGTIIISKDEVIENTLPDGSKIWLNDNSSIQYSGNYGKNNRVVYLKGEAFFQVVTNRKIPFIIYARNAEIEVTGTAFNVKASDEEYSVEVIVESGEVKISKDIEDIALKQEAYVSAGERIIVNDSKEIRKTENDNPNYLAWKTKIFVFEGTKLNEVIRLIGEVYNVTIEIDKDLNNCELFAKFENQSLDDILRLLNTPLSWKLTN